MDNNDKLQEQFNINIVGDDVIEASQLAKILESISNIYYNAADNFLIKIEGKVVVKEIKKGSIDIAIFFEYIKPLIATAISTLIIEIFKIRKHSKGKKPKSVKKENGNINITNINNENLTINQNTYNFYANNEDLEKNCANLSRAIYEDNLKHTNIKFDDGKDNIIYDEKDISNTSNEINTNFEKPKISNTKETLKIKKASFQGNSKWQVYILPDYKKCYDVKIEDSIFLNSVQKGEISISSKTILTVFLKTICPLKNGALTDKAEYSITKVLKIKE